MFFENAPPSAQHHLQRPSTPPHAQATQEAGARELRAELAAAQKALAAEQQRAQALAAQTTSEAARRNGLGLPGRSRRAKKER